MQDKSVVIQKFTHLGTPADKSNKKEKLRMIGHNPHDDYEGDATKIKIINMYIRAKKAMAENKIEANSKGANSQSVIPQGWL